MRSRLVCVLIVCLAASLMLAIGAATAAATLQFNVSFPSSVHATPLDGRLLVIVSPTNDPEPRLQADDAGTALGPPLWGRDVNNMTPGAKVVIGGAGTYGYPLMSFDGLEPGDYYVQALLNVYTTFHRSDGSVVKLHLPAGDGQEPFISPGNLVSTPKLLHLDPALGGTFALKLDQVLPPLEMVPPGGTTQQGNPIDTKHDRHIKIRSALLSKFWGRPMYIGADVLLPKGYDNAANRCLRYPVIWHQGHFGERVIYFDEDPTTADELSQWWMSDSAPRFILVSIRHENPFFDDSYAVNSANIGPYGDAITKELIPAVDKAFRTINARWARTLGGASTGGWESAAQMIFYPDLYSGAWMFADTRSISTASSSSTSTTTPTPTSWATHRRGSRSRHTGTTRALCCIRWNRRTTGSSPSATTPAPAGVGGTSVTRRTGPQGAGGYPVPIWNKQTGVIDHRVAEQWRRVDLGDYLKRHWTTVGPKVAGRMFFYCGLADNFYYENPTQLFQEVTKRLKRPKADFTFEYGPEGVHPWLPMTLDELLTDMAEYMADQAPAGTDVSGWIDL